MSLLVNFKSSRNLQRLPYFDLVYIDMSGEHSHPGYTSCILTFTLVYLDLSGENSNPGYARMNMILDSTHWEKYGRYLFDELLQLE